jgi:hypothetical protein
MLSTGWIVPQLEEREDFDLRRQELRLLEQAHRHPEQVARLAGQLLRQNAMQRSIIQKAAAHIQELEVSKALQYPTEPWLGDALRKLAPRPVRPV